MDPELLRRYSEELAHLREVGAEFAHEFPASARRLGMAGVDVADPYVERLLEGFAFLAARVQIKLDAEYPTLVQHLLETVYPNFVAPVPSMAVLRFQPDLSDPNLVRGARLPRGSAVLGAAPAGQSTPCDFRTAHALELWPLELVSVQYFSHAPDLPIARLPLARQVRGGLRLRLRLHGGARFDTLPLQALPLYISAPGDTALRLHELLHCAALGSWVPVDAAGAIAQWRHGDSVRALGFDADEALLPDTLRGYSGHRLVQEYAAMPQRLLFIEIGDLAARLQRVPGDEANLVILFSRGDAALESLVDAGSLALFCTPAINLFRKRLDRIDTTAGSFEHHVVPDRARPLDFELYAIESVVGHGIGSLARQRFMPLYASYHSAGSETHGHYTVRREPRQASERQQRDGTRTPYLGSEVYVSLVDHQQAPCGDDVRQLEVSGWVTNRDLPLLLDARFENEEEDEAKEPREPPRWQLDAPGPVRRIECLCGPTPPVQRLPRGQTGWGLVSLLTLNHLSIAGEDPQRAAQALRCMLQLFGPQGDSAWTRRIEGLRSVSARTVTRRLPGRGPLTFGSGIELQLEMDERAFDSHAAVLLGSVLERFVARHAAINCCTETALCSKARGVVHRWPVRYGSGPLL